MPSEEQHRTTLPVHWVLVLSCLWVGWTTGRAEQPTDPTGDVPLAPVHILTQEMQVEAAQWGWFR